MNSREAFEKEFPTPSNVVFNGKYVPRYAFDKTENASIHQWMWLSWQASRKQLLKELSEREPVSYSPARRITHAKCTLCGRSIPIEDCGTHCCTEHKPTEEE